MQQHPVSYSGLYSSYEDTRQIRKYENYALWTIPSAFPDNFDFSNKFNADVEHDYQSIGAMLVNTLATKLAGLLFPTNQSFFRIEFTEEMQKQLQKINGFDKKLAEKELIDIERKACRRLFRNAAYAQLVQMLRYLIITGNALVRREDNSLVVYSPRNFTILRDNTGAVLDIVIKESVAKSSLPLDVQQIPPLQGKQEFDDVTVYTRVKREYVGKKRRVKWCVTQQIEDIPIGKESTYPERLCPYIAVGWNLINGDSYCRGHVEDHAGDFAKLSDLSRALALYQLDACKVINLVKPGAVVDIDALEEAETGQWVQADPDAVKKHEGGEYNKIQALSQEVQLIFQRLATAFMYQGNMRDAERVTAVEIQFNAAEADKALGGVYSQLAEWVHLPLAYLLSYEEEPKLISAFANSEIQMQVLTGIAALGRTADVDALIKATNVLNAIVQPLKQVSARFDTELIVDRVMQSYGLNPEDWMLSEQAMQEQQQANQQAAAMVDPLQNQQAIQGVI
jgi:hypothetical protein